MQFRPSFALLVIVVLASCRRSSPPPTAKPMSKQASAFVTELEAVDAMKPGDVMVQADGVRRILSSDGAVFVCYAATAPSDSDKPINPTANADFVLQVMIFPRKASDGIGKVSLSVHANLSENGESMRVAPVVNRPERQAFARFTVEGMSFHLPGKWQIRFDITRDGVTSQAQDEIVIE